MLVKLTPRVQFHQPIGANKKCTYCAKLYQLIEIEFTLKFYVLHSKIKENELA